MARFGPDEHTADLGSASIIYLYRIKNDERKTKNQAQGLPNSLFAVLMLEASDQAVQ